MDAKQKEAALVKQELDKKKQTDLLIKSITGLNKNFLKVNKRADDDKKSKLGSDFSMATLSNALKQKGTDRVKSVKDMFSIKNALALAGHGEGSMLGEIAKNREDKMKGEGKKATAAGIYATESGEGIEWKKKYDAAMAKGDALDPAERVKLEEEYAELLKKGNELYDERLKLEERIAELEQDQTNAESIGLKLSKEKADELHAKKESYDPKYAEKAAKQGGGKKKRQRGDEMLTGTAKVSATDKFVPPPKEGAPTKSDYDVLEQKIAAALAKEEAGKTTSPVEPVDKKRTKDARYEDLTAEEAMGLSLADMAEVVQMVLKRDPESGLPDTVRFMHKDTVDDHSDKWEKTPMVGTAYEPLRNKKDPSTPLTMPESPELGVSKEIEDKFITERDAFWKEKYKDTPTDALTDEEKSKEILAALNKLVANSTVTEEDQLEAKKPESTVEKIKKETPANPVEKKSMADRAKGLADMVKDRGKAILEKAGGAVEEGIGSTLMNGAKSLLGGIGVGTLAAGAAAATGLAGAGQAIFGENGVANGGSGKNFISNFAGDYLGIGVESDEKIARDQAKLSKPSTTAREVQTANLEAANAEAAANAAKETAGSNKGPAVVDASVKSVTNNNNTINTKPTPPVRNFEPTFNNRLRTQFA